MLTYSDYFSQKATKNTFFAGANTGEGFEAEYSNHLDSSFDKVYIIKGGSGTGKSTLMRKCAIKGEESSLFVSYLLCSSDPDSIDGVIIGDGRKKVAIIDGTAPHNVDPIYPGSVEEIINCGLFWNSSYLEKRRDEICLYTDSKSKAYKRAYRFLTAQREVFLMQQNLVNSYLQLSKLVSAADRICDSLKGEMGDGRVIKRRTTAISMKGAVRLTSFEKASVLYGVDDFGFISPVFYAVMLEKLRGRGFDVCVSYSPLGGICELYVQSCDTAFVPSIPGREYDHRINLRRFADKKGMANVKQKRLFSSKCYTSMTDGALESLCEAGELHFRLENIYKEAMDFKSLEELGNDLANRLVKRF